MKKYTKQELLDLPEGTKVRCVTEFDCGGAGFGRDEVVVRRYSSGDDTHSCWFESETGLFKGNFLTWEEVEEIDSGLYRPALEERKNGKIQVHLVDQGFPNALLEIARVMTWAGEVKGYKEHDWKNLPNPENGFQGAASRHRMLHNIQRITEKLEPIDCKDEESKLLHKAHEAFNVLAELELILTRKID